LTEDSSVPIGWSLRLLRYSCVHCVACVALRGNPAEQTPNETGRRHKMLSQSNKILQ